MLAFNSYLSAWLLWNKYPDLDHYQNFTKKWIDVCENIADIFSLALSQYLVLYVGYLIFDICTNVDH